MEATREALNLLVDEFTNVVYFTRFWNRHIVRQQNFPFQICQNHVKLFKKQNRSTTVDQRENQTISYCAEISNNHLSCRNLKPSLTVQKCLIITYCAETYIIPFSEASDQTLIQRRMEKNRCHISLSRYAWLVKKIRSCFSIGHDILAILSYYNLQPGVYAAWLLNRKQKSMDTGNPGRRWLYI